MVFFSLGFVRYAPALSCMPAVLHGFQNTMVALKVHRGWFSAMPLRGLSADLGEYVDRNGIAAAENQAGGD
jgi:hypothetical protein